MKEAILKLLNENPNYSSTVIAEKLGKSRNTINKYINELNIPRDRKLLQKCNNTQRSFPIQISENVEQIILGSILGDGNITKHKRFIDSKKNINSCLNIKHSIKQTEYTLFKYSLLNDNGLKTHISKVKFNKNITKINNRIITDNGFIVCYTRKCISLNKYRDIFYKDIKYINKYIYKLKALGLAIWFQDDGSKNISGYYLHTQSFTLKDMKLLQKVLLHNFNINSNIHKTRNQYNIYIKKESVKIFNNLILPFMCPSMKYKLHL